MTQPLFPATIGTQSLSAEFLTIKTMVKKFGKSDGQTGLRCLDKALLAQGRGGYAPSWPHKRTAKQGRCLSAAEYNGLVILRL